MELRCKVKLDEQRQMFSNKIVKMKVEHEQEKKRIKKVAVSFAIEYYKSISREITSIFAREALLVLKQFTDVRHHLKSSFDQIRDVSTNYCLQEGVISELRTFVDQNLRDALRVLDLAFEGTGKIKYITINKQNGRASIDRTVSTNPMHLFSLYTSVVQDQTFDNPLSALKEEN